MPELGITSNEVFPFTFALPKRAVIAGAGYIANEFAGIFNELGVEVTLVTRGDKMLRSYDQEIVEKLVGYQPRKGHRYPNELPVQRRTKAGGRLHPH